MHQMHPLGVLAWCTGAIRLHKDGDGISGYCRAWHPVTWLILVLMVVPCALMGERLLHVVPLRLSSFWKQNLDQLQWVTPFTKLSTLKPFKHRIKVPPEAIRMRNS